jgi:hypothetical protein
MAGFLPRLAFKVLTTAIAIPVGKALTKSTTKAWEKARPQDPPHNPRQVQTDWRDALIWAALTGLGSALAQVISTKGADTAWRAITGKPSPRPKEPKPPKVDKKAKKLQAA